MENYYGKDTDMKELVANLVKITENNANAIIAQTQSNQNILQRITIVEGVIKNYADKTVDHEDRIAEIEEYVNSEYVSPTQKRFIRQAVGDKTKELFPNKDEYKMYNRVTRSWIYQYLWSIYDVSSYEYIPKKKYKECISKINDWYPKGGISSIKEYYMKTH